MRQVVVGLAVLTALSICQVSPATADSISYTVDGWSGAFPGPYTPPDDATWGPDGYPGDTVELSSYTGTLDLTPGSYVLKINTLLWTIDYTYGGEPWEEFSFVDGAPRGISFAAVPSGTLNQNVNLQVNYDNDYLSLDEGLASSFTVGGYLVAVKPLGLDEVGGEFAGSNPWVQGSRDVLAQFDVSAAAVPEPSTLIGLASLGVVGIGAAWRRRKK